MNINLTGLCVLVTGAGRGIGRALATGLAESGATVAMHANRSIEATRALASRMGGRHAAIQADLENPDECRRLFEEASGLLGRIDVLVNNAGLAIEAPLDAAEDDWLSAWDTTLDVNLRAAAILSRLAVRHFIARGRGGRLIHIASRAAFRGDTAEYLAYAASKGGMVSLSRSIARAYGKDGITSFVIAPGFTRTDMAQEFIDRYGEAHAAKDIALDRLTEPEDITPTVILLASGLADHATGSSIDFNAGSYVH